MKTLQKNWIEVVEQSGKYILTEEQMKKLWFEEEKKEDIVPDKTCEYKGKSYFIDHFYNAIEGNWVNINHRPTKELAEACIALSQLCMLRNETWKRYNKSIGKDGMWEPDYTSSSDKLTIINFLGGIDPSIDTHIWHILVFPTREIRNQFLEKHRELIETAKPLL